MFEVLRKKLNNVEVAVNNETFVRIYGLPYSLNLQSNLSGLIQNELIKRL